MRRARATRHFCPCTKKKRPPRRVDVAVCLLTWKRRVLVTRRDERMLGGLYVFCLLEDETRPERAEALLREAGLPCRFTEDLGRARHVFTHRVWEMQLWHFSLEDEPSPQALEACGGRMVSGEARAPAPAHSHARGGAGGAGAAPAPGKSGPQRLTRDSPWRVVVDTLLQRPCLPDSAAASAA